MNQAAYDIIDLNNWERKSHWEYYRNILPVSYSLTARLDVTGLVNFCRKHGRKFYGSFLYAAAKTVNEMDCMRMMVDERNNPGIFKESHVNFTVFHKDDQTFSDVWCEYHDNYKTFYKTWTDVCNTYGSVKGIKARPMQPANFFCISCIPWLDFSGYQTHTPGAPALFPVITFGKYTWKEERYSLPLTLTIAHAAADGYHSAMFFENLQKNLEAFWIE